MELGARSKSVAVGRHLLLPAAARSSADAHNTVVLQLGNSSWPSRLPRGMRILVQLSRLPAPPLVKKRIESLIEREYMARDPERATVYKYLA